MKTTHCALMALFLIAACRPTSANKEKSSTSSTTTSADSGNAQRGVYLNPLAKLDSIDGSQYFKMTALVDSVSQTDVYRFPQVMGLGTAAKKINTWLHVWELETLPGKYRKSPFEKIKPSERRHSGVYWMDYQVHANNNRYLSVEIAGEYWSAYGEVYYNYYNFDTKNGKPILMDLIFTTEGYEALREKIFKARMDTIKAFMAKLDTTVSFQLEQYGIYENCLSRFEDDELSYYSMTLSDTSIIFTGNRCSAHANRALDDLGRFENELLLTDIKPYLSDYGNYLFFEDAKKDNVQVNEWWWCLPGVYKGKLDGKISVTLLVYAGERDGTFNALYFYDKIAEQIDLDPSRNQAGNWVLIEQLDDGKNEGKFVFTSFNRQVLKGKWISADGTKAYEVTLK